MTIFETLYRELLKENGVSINNVPREVIGLSNSILELPDHKPYGFWVDRHGNFITVSAQGHDRAMKQIVASTKAYYRSKNLPLTQYPSYGEFLNNLGWCRVVLGYKNVMYEIGDGITLSSAQQKFLKIIQEQYELEGIVKD